MAVGDFYTYTGTLSAAAVTVLVPSGGAQYLMLSGAGSSSNFVWAVGSANVEDSELRGLVLRSSGASLSLNAPAVQAADRMWFRWCR